LAASEPAAVVAPSGVSAAEIIAPVIKTKTKSLAIRVNFLPSVVGDF
jgi:hypothetical protein